jgi:hypothetical protein
MTQRLLLHPAALAGADFEQNHLDDRQKTREKMVAGHRLTKARHIAATCLE